MATHTRDELEQAFIRYWRTGAVGEAWSAWTDLFTADALYVEHVLGTMRGRDAIRAWIEPIMQRYGEIYTAYEWHMVDPASGRICVYMQNRRDDPSGPGVIDFPGITILHYAGGGRFDYEEDYWSVPGAQKASEAYEAARKAHDPEHRTKMTRRDWGRGPEWTRGGPSYVARRPLTDLPPLA